MIIPIANFISCRTLTPPHHPALLQEDTLPALPHAVSPAGLYL